MIRSALTTIALTCALLAGNTASADTPAPFVPRQTVVRLNPGQSIGPVLSGRGLSVVGSIPERQTYVLQIPVGIDEEQVVSDLSSDPRVRHADLHYLAEDTDPGGTTQDIFLARSISDFQADPLPGLLGLPAAHQTSRGAGILVAVIDSGVDATHPVLAGRVSAGGYDLLLDAPGAADAGVGEFFGHGTMVAGLVLRIAPDATILPLRVMDGQGRATSFNLARGIYRAIDSGARIVNISMGSIGEPDVVLDAVTEARDRGVIVVASAGNDNAESDRRFPAAFTDAGVVSVTATSSAGVRAPFANFGEWCSISAPGMNLISTMPGDAYASASGTSFATPLVSGALALLLSHCPTSSPAQSRAHLLAASTPIDAINPNYQTKLGAGLVNPALVASEAASGPRACGCVADFDRSGEVVVDDIFVFLNAWFAGCSSGTLASPCLGRGVDLDASGASSVDDIFLFLNAWFAGC
jgi:subtilisin family serine protease